MKPLDLDAVSRYVNENIVDFHRRRIKSLEELRLEKLLNKNPYLFRAKDITEAHELIKGLLDAFLSSSEEKLFGDFLENLALFVAQKPAMAVNQALQASIWNLTTWILIMLSPSNLASTGATVRNIGD